MKYNINGEIVDLKKGHGIFVNSGQMHFGFSDEHNECDFYCILFHPILLCPVPPFENDFVLPLMQNKSLPFLELHPHISWQKEILAHIGSLYPEKGHPSASLRALSAFARIWALLWEHAPEDDGKENRQSQNLAIIKNMVTFIQKNLKKKISLEDIAATGLKKASAFCAPRTCPLQKSPFPQDFPMEATTRKPSANGLAKAPHSSGSKARICLRDPATPDGIPFFIISHSLCQRL